MEVVVTIPDRFVERLLPSGIDASRVLLEQLVDQACDNGRIDAEQADDIMGCAVKERQDGGPSNGEDLTDEAFKRYLNGTVPPWIDNPEQVRRHKAVAKVLLSIWARAEETADPSLRSGGQVIRNHCATIIADVACDANHLAQNGEPSFAMKHSGPYFRFSPSSSASVLGQSFPNRRDKPRSARTLPPFWHFAQ